MQILLKPVQRFSRENVTNRVTLGLVILILRIDKTMTK